MKRIGKISILILLAVIIFPLTTPMAQGIKPYKEVKTEILDGPFGDPPIFYAKGVLHSVLIGHPQEDESIRVKISTLQKFRIHELEEENEAGDFLGTAVLTYEYAGTVTLGPGDSLILETGVLVGTWIINADIELPYGTYKGHWVKFYEEGVVVKEIVRGAPPFLLP